MSSLPILRTSERRAFKRCIWRWWQSYRMGLVPVGSISDPLWFGTGVHLALADWYIGPGLKRGRQPAETFDEWATGELRFIKTQYREKLGITTLIEERLEPAAELGRVMLEGYVSHYGRDDHMHIIQPEHSGQINVMDPEDPKRVMLIYAFTYDLVYRDLADELIKLQEHKTAKAISLDHLPLDDQGGSYWAIASQELAASGLIGPKERVRGIEYNFLRKAKPDDRPKNAEGHACNKPTRQHYLDALEAHWRLADWRRGELQDALVKAGKMKLDQLVELAAANNLVVLGEVSKVQPAPLFVRELIVRTAKERAKQIQKIQDEALHMQYVREGILPLTKNPTFDCRWDCDFYQLCKMDDGGHADTQEYRQIMFTQQDPYADHRKSTEEG